MIALAALALAGTIALASARDVDTEIYAVGADRARL